MSLELDTQALRETLVNMLRANYILTELNDDQIAQFANRAQFVEYKSGETIVRQDEPGHHFYFVLEGQVRVIDTSRKPAQLLAYLNRGDFFGERALLFDRPRAATVDVAVDTKLAIFDRATWGWLTTNVSGISEGFRKLEDLYEEKSHTEFPGRQIDEVVIRKDKRHILSFVATLPGPLILMIIGLGISILMGQFDISLLLIRIVTIFSIVLGIALTIYNYVEWANDDFIITSDRVIHIERTIIYGESREEAPLTAIQDVSVDISNFFTRLFGYYTITIQTAGAGNIVFDGLKDGNEIKAAIFEQSERARERVEASDTASIRKSLVERMGWDVGPVEVATLVATGDAPQKQSIQLPMVINYFVPKVKEIDGNKIIWRKHYFILLKLVALPTTALFAILYLFLAALLGLSPFTTSDYFIAFILLALWLLNWVWYAYQYDTWRKDLYIVTDSVIIDIHGSPFGLGKEESREGTFDNIQNTTYRSPSFFTRILNMGDVIIETAGTADTFTFEDVYNYREVQQEVSKRLLAFQEDERKKSRAVEERRYIRWLGEYHDLAQRTGEIGRQE